MPLDNQKLIPVPSVIKKSKDIAIEVLLVKTMTPADTKTANKNSIPIKVAYYFFKLNIRNGVVIVIFKFTLVTH